MWDNLLFIGDVGVAVLSLLLLFVSIGPIN